MKVEYRQLFLKDLKKLKKTEFYDRVYELVFMSLVVADDLQNFTNVKAMVGHPNHYRIRMGDYRIGLIIQDDSIEMMRVLHRREFYRYFP